MMRERQRPQWLLPVSIGALTVVLIVIALAREPMQLDPSTPEGVVQRYLEAVSEEDYEGAVDYLDPDEFEGCSAAELGRFAPREPFTASLRDASPVIGSDDEVVVSITIRHGTDGLFESSWEHDETFRLSSRDGAWRIIGDPWPHLLHSCPDEETRAKGRGL